MNTTEWLMVGVFVVLVVVAVSYAAFRLMREDRSGLDERSTRLARRLGYPRFLAPLLAKPLTGREKIGWAIVLLLIVAAVVFT